MISYTPNRWLGMVCSVRGTVIMRIWPRIMVIGLLACGVEVLEQHRLLGSPIETLGHTLTGVALGMLLVFRNNASYDRYWEARRCWSAITASCRNMLRSCQVCGGAAAHLVPLIGLWPESLKRSLRGERLAAHDMSRLTADAAGRVVQAADQSGALATEIAREVAGQTQAGTLKPCLALEGQLNELIAQQAACERIRNTPMPFAHAVHIRQLLLIYVLTLPLLLAPRMGWGSVPAVIIIAFALIGIEEAGVEIEDPFGTDPNDLPLDDICDDIRQRAQYTPAA
jgi:putative membrane protein